MIMKNLVIIFLLCTVGTACSTSAGLKNPQYSPSQAIIPPTKSKIDGAIYDVTQNLFLFEDVKARRVGDLITVILEESTNASKSASTEADKSSDIDLPNPTIFNSANRLTELANSITSEREFDGEGETTQENSIEGNVTVTVHEVFPNGYLLVKGEKLLELNEGSEVVRISGIVRPADVSTNNTILSNQIANAEITYKGNGIVSDSSKPGWLLKLFFSSIWPI